jgi:imidazoleglycerol-phosphate dehydratase
VNQGAAAAVRIDVHGRGVGHVETGLPVLNDLLKKLAETARFNLVLDIQPSDVEAEVDAAGAVLGAALTEAIHNEDARGYGSESLASAEALAHVVIERSPEPLVVTNVDLSEARVGGLDTDIARRFLETFAEHAGLVLHVRLLDGTDGQHVLEAIFKALGAALAQACEYIGGKHHE